MTYAKEFWENKILSWEDGRYDLASNLNNSTKLEEIANKGSNSLRYRINQCGEMLSQHVSEKNVVEIGCGRGLLTEKLMAAGAKSYLGLDIANSAIEAANNLHLNLINAGNVNFSQCAVNSLPNSNADVVFSLGLLDWLTDEEINTLFNWQSDAQHFHAIAEKRFSITQLVHKIYVYTSYGHRTKGYVPRYYTVEKILGFMKCLSITDRFVFRDGRLTFGAFVSTLPIGENISEA